MKFNKKIYILIAMIITIHTLNLFSLSEEDLLRTKWVQEESFYENSNFKFYLFLNGDNSFNFFSFEIGYSGNGFFECVNDTIYLNYNLDNVGNFTSQKVYYLENEKLHLSYLKKLENEFWRIKEIDVSKQIYFKDKAYSLEQPFSNIPNTKWISSYHGQPDYYEFFVDSTFIYFDSNLDKKFSGKFSKEDQFTLNLDENSIVCDPKSKWKVNKNFMSYNYKLVPLNKIVYWNNYDSDHNTIFDPNYYFIQDTSYVTRNSPDILHDKPEEEEYNPENLPGLINYEEVSDSTGKLIHRSYSFKFSQKNNSKTIIKREESNYDMDLQIKEIKDGSSIISEDFTEYSKPYIDNFVKPEYQLENRLMGSVSVSFYILPDNSVTDVEIVSTTNEYLNDYILKIIHENKFVSAQDSHGNPVKALVIMTYFFAE